MRTAQFLTALALTFAVALPALAEGDSASCGDASRDQWMSEDAVKAKAVELGYDVRKVKEEDGCYEVYGIDKNGAKAEIYMHPVTGEVVKTKSDS